MYDFLSISISKDIYFARVRGGTRAYDVSVDTFAAKEIS